MNIETALVALPKLVTKRGRKQAHSPGRGCQFIPQMQQLTDRRFMSRTQRAAFDLGEEIWV